ncbi:hypothetical protein B9Z19DRAFT_675946 [Tuber borchii]|uniref:Uncharacterized protein n=1 Tax=Tuber borchii TaxID=42251 RepID=A0A2T6ZAL2_TUBBO|nr:hypothetical protein B9Z19DRAFT_675946 [Tuber borchii]
MVIHYGTITVTSKRSDNRVSNLAKSIGIHSHNNGDSRDLTPSSRMWKSDLVSNLVANPPLPPHQHLPPPPSPYLQSSFKPQEQADERNKSIAKKKERELAKKFPQPPTPQPRCWKRQDRKRKTKKRPPRKPPFRRSSLGPLDQASHPHTPHSKHQPPHIPKSHESSIPSSTTCVSRTPTAMTRKMPLDSPPPSVIK